MNQGSAPKGCGLGVAMWLKHNAWRHDLSYLETNSGTGFRILKGHGAGEVEAVYENRFLGIQRFDGCDTESACSDPVASNMPTQRAETLLFEFIRSALVVTAGCEHALFTLENHCQVRGQFAALFTFRGFCYSKHHPQASPIRTGRAREADADAAAIRARTTIAFQLSVVQIDIEIQRAAYAGAKIAVAAREAAMSDLWAGRRQPHERVGRWRWILWHHGR